MIWHVCSILFQSGRLCARWAASSMVRRAAWSPSVRASRNPEVSLSLISNRATQKLLVLLAGAAGAVVVLDLSTGLTRFFDTVGLSFLASLFVVLAWGVGRRHLSSIDAQRIAVLSTAIYLMGSLASVWLGGGPVDAYALGSSSIWLLCLDVLLFTCLPQRSAALWAALVAMTTLCLEQLSPAAASPALHALAMNAFLAQAVLCAILFGVGTKIRQLARIGANAGLAEVGDQAATVNDLVHSREAALRKLLRQSEQALQAAARKESELRMMLNAFPGVVLRIEPDGSLSYCNDQGAELLGLAVDEMEGRHAASLLGADSYASFQARNLQIRASGKPASFEANFDAGDGRFRELLVTQFVVAAGADHRLASYQIGVDISERKRHETALARAKAEAEQADRAKSRFMSSMSHELRTPLNAVLGLAQMLRVQAPQLPPQQQMHLDTIAEAGRNLLALVDKTMDLSRMDAGDMCVTCQPVNLARLVASALHSVSAMANAQGVTLAPAPAHRDLVVLADPVRLRQVLMNLLSNAIKYNRSGGAVAVRITRRGDMAQLVVQDTGPGMAEVQLQQLFQPYNRLGAERGPVQGTGLGLSIARGLVTLMQGRLDVRSSPGVGSEFSVWLPLCAADRVEAPEAPTTDFACLDQNEGLQGSLLYVEDNEVNIIVFEACLARRPGVKVHVARDGAEALLMARQVHPQLVVLDLHLPDQTGLELAQALRGQPALDDVPLVLLTADATHQTTALAQAHGIHDVWHKPFDAARMLGNIDRLMRVAQSA